LLLESILIENFLPFKDTQEIKFSTSKEKNVTLIQGDNGAGKTSLAQAFGWCLYGKTSYSDGNVMNAEVNKVIAPGSSRKVSVMIKLEHGGVFYTITRSQKYSRSSSGTMERPAQPEFEIVYREKGEGQSEHVPLNEQPSMIRELLSSELSHYFFFDGEHVKNMRRELERGRSTDFANAVKSLLGLQHIAKAIEHLETGGNKVSVARTFRQRFSSDGDNILVSGTKDIDQLEARIERFENEKEEAEIEEEIARKEKKRYQELLKENKESEDVIKSLEASKRKVETLANTYLTARKDIVSNFKEGQYIFFAQRLLSDALKELTDEKQIDKGVPDVTERTIKFLVDEQRRCICGTDLKHDLNAVNHLKELLKFIPPQSVGTSISNFSKECKTHLMYRTNLPERLAELYKTMRDAENSVEYAMKEKDAFQAQFDSINNIDIANLRKLFNKKQEDENNAIQRKGAIVHNVAQAKKSIEEIKKKIDSVTIQNENNKKVKKYLDYAIYLHEELSSYYEKQEILTRKEFENTVNGIFRQIYEGELWLQIDDNYGVMVHAEGITEESEEWKTSTGQTLAITLAFIAGILKISKKNSECSDCLLTGTTYPLVMDAPLSEFDTKRIEKICEVFPEIAEQMIIITFDKDAQLIESHLGERIGKRYEIVKVSDLESYFEEK